MPEQIELKILGMRCTACSSGIEKKLMALDGIESVCIDLNSKSARILVDEKKWDYLMIAKTIHQWGYRVYPMDEWDGSDSKNYKKELVTGLILYIPLFILAMFFPAHPQSAWLQFFLTTPILIFLGKSYYISAFHSLKSKIFTMDLLVSMGSFCAWFYSTLFLFGLSSHIYFDGAGAILIFITLGRVIEESSKQKAFQSLEDLFIADQKSIRLLVGEEVKEVSPNLVFPGQVVLVPPGENILFDSVVLKGQSCVDESLLTGEATPIFKSCGDRLVSGSRNLDQALEIKVVQSAATSTLAQIGKKIREARMEKANLQRTADKIAAIFVPTILALAIADFFFWLIFADLSTAFLNATSTILIACPCALGLATPAAVSVGLFTALKHGVLIKSVRVIENISRVDHLVLDKTGTLTIGKPKLKKIIIAKNGLDEERVLALAFGMEKNTHHPFATAILTQCSKRGIKPCEFNNIQGNTGKGICGITGEKKWFLGSLKWMQENKIPVNSPAFMGFFLGCETELIAEFHFEDPFREGIQELISFFKTSKKRITLISGDRQENVQNVAKQVGIENFFSGFAPEDKLNQIISFQQKKEKVAMIGDGINDSAALAKSDLGISFHEGSDLAKSGADLILMNPSLKAIPFAFEISQGIHRKIRQNYFWAICYNAAMIPLAMAGFLNPMIAAACMTLSSICVIANSLLLARTGEKILKPEREPQKFLLANQKMK